MILFGHLGLTTETIKAYEVISYKDKKLSDKVLIDYRIVLIGSILPENMLQRCGVKWHY